MNPLKILKFFNRFIFPILIGYLIFVILRWTGLVIYATLFIGSKLFKRRRKFFSYFGRIANIKGNYTKAASWYYMAYKLDTKDALIATDAAYTALRLGDLEKARPIIENLDVASLVGESRVKATNNLAILYWKSDNLPKAVESLEDLFSKNEKSTSLYGNLTYFYILNNQLEKAFSLAKEAFEYNSKDIVIIENLARASHLTGDFETAKTHYSTLESLAPSYPEAWFNLALYYSDINENEKAQNALRSGLKCNFTFLSNVTKEQFESMLKTISTAQS